MKTIFFDKWGSLGHLEVHLAKSLLRDRHRILGYLPTIPNAFFRHLSHKNPTDKGYVQ